MSNEESQGNLKQDIYYAMCECSPEYVDNILARIKKVRPNASNHDLAKISDAIINCIADECYEIEL